MLMRPAFCNVGLEIRRKLRESTSQSLRCCLPSERREILSTSASKGWKLWEYKRVPFHWCYATSLSGRCWPITSLVTFERQLKTPQLRRPLYKAKDHCTSWNIYFSTEVESLERSDTGANRTNKNEVDKLTVYAPSSRNEL